jgi:hypothetical protein
MQLGQQRFGLVVVQPGDPVVVKGGEEQSWSPTDRVRAHQRVLQRRVVGDEPVSDLVAVVATHGLEEVRTGPVPQPQPPHPLPHLRRQGLVGSEEVDPQRVATGRRCDAGVEDRARRRLGEPGHVGVPGELRWRPIGVVLDVGDRFGPAHQLRYRVDEERPPDLGEATLLVVVEVLVAQEEHMVLGEGGAQQRRLLRVHGPGVEPVHLGPQRGVERLDAHVSRCGHGGSPCSQSRRAGSGTLSA